MEVVAVANQTCSLQATVVTSFEAMACDECREMFGVTALKSRGKITFDLPVELVHKTLEMRSIDNVYVVVYTANAVGFNSNKEESLERLGQTLTTSTDQAWEAALEVWRRTASPSMSKDTSIAGNDEIKFRVTCHRSGDSKAHSFGSPEAAVSFGGLVQDRFGWRADMTGFDIEVMLNVFEDQVCVTLALTCSSLHKRNITVFGSMTLRATVAHNMLRLANVRESDVVCDPMCGTGAIPIEGALCWPKAFFVCGDNYEMAAPKTRQNAEKINEELKAAGKLPMTLSVVRWDVTCLPLKTNSVDVIITDLPFGKRSGSKVDNRILYPKALYEMARICRPNTGRAVLLTQDRRTMIQTLKQLSYEWRAVQTLTTNIGGLTAGVYLLYRTTRYIV